jgi:hypothetical protein
MRSTTTIRRRDRVAFRELADGAGGVLLDLDTAAYFGVNKVGMAIWGILEIERTLDQLVDQLGQKLEGPPPSLRQDVEEFLTELSNRELVVLESTDR